MDLLLKGYGSKPAKRAPEADPTRARELIDSALAADPVDKSLMEDVATTLGNCITRASELADGKEDDFSGPVDQCEARSATKIDELAVAFNVQGVSLSPDLRTFRWGDSQKAVLAGMGERPINQTPGSVMYATTLGSAAAILDFTFVDDHLARAGYMLQEQHSDDGAYMSDFDSLESTLADKYGKPTSSGLQWSNTLFKNDPNRIGLALASGHVRSRSTWELPRTKIVHIVLGDNYKITHGILYTSKDYAWDLEQASTEAEAADL